MSDVHLGKRHFNLAEREEDFYRAFAATMEEAVGVSDLILIAGDLFNDRSIRPSVLRQAMEILRLPKQAGIPVVAVEGNHDRAMHSTEETWVRVLEAEGLLKVLGKNGIPEVVRESGIRIVGFPYRGYMERQSIVEVREMLEGTLPEPTVLLCHVGVSEIMPFLPGGMSVREFEPLRGLVDYVLTGHFHVRWDDGFVFCPGCLEPTAITETAGGFYLLDGKDVQYVPLGSYYSPRQFLVSVCRTLEEFSAQLSGLAARVDRPVWKVVFIESMPTREEVMSLFGENEPLKLLLSYDLASEDQGPIDLDGEDVEGQVFSRLAPGMEGMVIRLKEMALAGESAEAIVKYLEEEVVL